MRPVALELIMLYLAAALALIFGGFYAFERRQGRKRVWVGVIASLAGIVLVLESLALVLTVLTLRSLGDD
jgi:drug/metabolite transporter superfamily protein YnfA